MKVFKFGLIIAAAAFLTLGLSGMSYALHDGGVAHCDACHTMHNSQDGLQVTATPGAHLQKMSDPSSTCLNCHSNYGQFGDGSEYRAAGDFYWITKDYSWTAWGQTHESKGDSHGHNIIAADFGLTLPDQTHTIAPGGTYLAGQLGCNSCHDPHGSQGNESLLYGIEETAGDYPGGYDFTNAAPVFLNAGRTTDISDADHSAYGSGMAEWCGNCHGDFVDAIGKHVSGNNSGAALNGLATNYNAYVSTDDLTGVQATAYWEAVPFETGTDDPATLDNASTSGPTASATVMCLTCHRAHATAFPDIGRWYFEDTFIVADSHPQITDTGATAEDVANMYNGRVYTAEQRSLCNKCHIQD